MAEQDLTALEHASALWNYLSATRRREPADAVVVCCSYDLRVWKFPQDVSNVVGVFGVMHEMVGDVDRIRQYPARGFQVSHSLPQPILESWRALIAAGFGRHLLTAA